MLKRLIEVALPLKEVSEHPDAEGDAPGVLNPFAGGGSIPLETFSALRFVRKDRRSCRTVRIAFHTARRPKRSLKRR